jgi:hypothetical protein
MIFFLKRLGVIGSIDYRVPRSFPSWSLGTRRFTALTVGITLILLQITCLQAQPRCPTRRPAGSTPLTPAEATRDASRFLTPAPATLETARFLSPAEAANTTREEHLVPNLELGNEAPHGQEPKQKDDDEFGLTLPTRDQLFRLHSEQSFLERLRKELPKVKNVEFPKDVPFVPEVEKPISFPLQTITPVFSQVCYRPLYFEDKKTERFGKYVPCVQPLVSTSRFYVDVIMLPCRLWLKPPWVFECDNR